MERKETMQCQGESLRASRHSVGHLADNSDKKNQGKNEKYIPSTGPGSAREGDARDGLDERRLSRTLRAYYRDLGKIYVNLDSIFRGISLKASRQEWDTHPVLCNLLTRSNIRRRP